MVKVRFAPSPTGYLHLGNIRTALFNYLFAKANKGTFLLRMEDTDRVRSEEKFAKAQLEDLLWMGIRWDEGPEVGGDNGPYYQSQRLEIYQGYVDKLIEQDKAYYCYVTEKETEDMKYHAKLEKRPPRFDNRGRDFSAEEIEKRKSEGISPTVRFKIQDPLCEMVDLIRGKVSFNLDEMVGDFVIQRPDGMPTFHLAVCIDDCLMGVTHVIRGEDHLSNTPKHILLMKAMGFTPPQYGHLSLVHGPGGEPLSKRIESVSVRQFRQNGYLPHALANYISLLGWSPGGDREILSWEELKSLFSLERISKSSSNFDRQKLDWVNAEHLRLMPEDAFARAAMAFLKENKMLNHDEEFVQKVLPIFKDNINRFDELPARLEILSDDVEYEDDELVSTQSAREIFQESLKVLPHIQGEGEAFYKAFIDAVKPNVQAKGKDLFHPLRVALTGKLNGPELKKVFPILGKIRIEKRLKNALKLAD